jgi:uncharacterized protein with NAD-binding domain and iron-sulfur cluster
MKERRIVIVGGGMAALAAAFELTRTKALQARHKVTIYQMGWRLGGKAATGRDANWRVVEHGLHVWFGFYENAARLLKDAYLEWKAPPGQSICSWDGALKARRTTVIGDGDNTDIVQLTWPRTDGSPGDEGADLSLWRCIAQLLGVIRAFYGQVAERARLPATRFDADPMLIALLWSAGVTVSDILVESSDRPMQVTPPEALVLGETWAERLSTEPSLQNAEQARGLVAWLRTTAVCIRANSDFNKEPQGIFLSELIDVGTAVVGGVVLDMLIAGRTVFELDRMDFREWLVCNGAARDSAYRSRVVRALYDSTFQYCEGDRRRPSYAAGSAVQAVLRLFGTYRDAFAFKMQAGMGEVVVAPIYGVLKQRGVKFEFFHKLSRIDLTPERDAISRLIFARQVFLKNRTYTPTIDPKPENGYLLCWPDAPLWDQIKDGSELAKQGLDLESYWCLQKVEDVPLARGPDFDDVILAIPLGGFKKLNAAPGPCDELMAASGRFRAMTEALTLVPSVSVQAWCTRTLEELGWPPGEPQHAADEPAALTDRPPVEAPQMSTGPRPLNIWADMSQVLRYEHWRSPPKGPKSLHYFCDALPTQLYRAPPQAGDTPRRSHRLAQETAIEWFARKARYVWPRSSNSGGTFDWNVLFAPDDLHGPERIYAQIVRPRVDPIECCVVSSAGSTEWRLKADSSGFAHLYLAGTWIDTGFNTDCIEAAVMSGMQASRALCNLPTRVLGELFLHRGSRSLLEEILALAVEGVLALVALADDLAIGGTFDEENVPTPSMLDSSRRIRR